MLLRAAFPWLTAGSGMTAGNSPLLAFWVALSKLPSWTLLPSCCLRSLAMPPSRAWVPPPEPRQMPRGPCAPGPALLGRAGLSSHRFWGLPRRRAGTGLGAVPFPAERQVLAVPPAFLSSA